MKAPPATIRIAGPEDLRRDAARYPDFGHLILAPSEKTTFVADAEGELVGTLTVGPKNGTLVLHGMLIYDGRRRCGYGTQLLRALGAWLGSRECYTIPYQHLVEFYGKIGFVEIPADVAPAFLVKEMTVWAYERGVDLTIMRRG